MRWEGLREGDTLLSSNGKVWLILEARAKGRSVKGHALVWMRWLDLRSGRVHAAEQDGSRELHDGEVLRGKRVITLKPWRLEGS